MPRFYREAKAEKEGESSEPSVWHAHPDVIVVDPPRKGLDASLIDVMCDAAPDRIVYVSCDSATLSRDLRLLGEKGYRVERVRPVDNFCQTVHVETVVQLINQNTKAKHHVNIDVDAEDYYRIKDLEKKK